MHGILETKAILNMGFDEFGLNDKILEAISYMGYEKASEIQELTIPVILDGEDLLACAQTGTGKTALLCFPSSIIFRLKITTI